MRTLHLLALVAAGSAAFASPSNAAPGCEGATADWCKTVVGTGYAIHVTSEVDASDGPVRTTCLSGSTTVEFQSSSNSHSVQFPAPSSSTQVEVQISGSGCGPSTPATVSERAVSEIPDCL